MTSTSFNVGLNDNTRLSSRVLRPPGGAHSNIFGEPEPPRAPRPMPHQKSSIGMTDEAPTNGAEVHIDPPEKPQEVFVAPEKPSPPEVSPTSEVAPVMEIAAPEAPQKNAEPSAKPPAKQEPPRAEPPKRVRVPPGGFSSGLW